MPNSESQDLTRWLFARWVLGWTGDRAVIRALPFPYMLFALYAAILFRVFRRVRYLPGGRIALKLSRGLARLLGYGIELELNLSGRRAVLLTTDPRFLQVISELSKSSIETRITPYLREGDTFIDVGANQGAYSIIASNIVGESGRVFAIEAQPVLASVVKKSLEKNPAQYEVLQLAVGESPSKIDFIVPNAYSGTAGRYASFSGRGKFSTINVEVDTLDNLSAKLPLHDTSFIKLDIEGSEYAFLQGARRLLTSSHAVILVEINPPAMQAASVTPEMFQAILASLGYNHYRSPKPDSEIQALESLDYSKQHDVCLLKDCHLDSRFMNRS